MTQTSPLTHVRRLVASSALSHDTCANASQSWEDLATANVAIQHDRARAAIACDRQAIDDEIVITTPSINAHGEHGDSGEVARHSAAVPTAARSRHMGDDAGRARTISRVEHWSV